MVSELLSLPRTVLLCDCDIWSSGLPSSLLVMYTDTNSFARPVINIFRNCCRFRPQRWFQALTASPRRLPFIATWWACSRHQKDTTYNRVSLGYRSRMFLHAEQTIIAVPPSPLCATRLVGQEIGAPFVALLDLDDTSENSCISTLSKVPP